MVIKIKKSKTDQYRAGDEILVAKGQSLACPYNMLMKYVGLANVNINSFLTYLFRPLYRSKNKCGLIKVNKPISYTTARECIVKRLKLVAPELNLGLHSLRSDGATMAVNSDVNERCWKRHGRWKSDSSFSLNIFYLHKSCKWDWTQVMTTLVKSFPFYKDINKK